MFPSNTSKGIGNKWSGTKMLTEILSIKGYNFVKFHDRVMSSCLKVGMMVTKKCMKFQRNTSKGIRNTWGGTKNLTKVPCQKRECNFVKIHDRVISSCLEVGLMVTNKYSEIWTSSHTLIAASLSIKASSSPPHTFSFFKYPVYNTNLCNAASSQPYLIKSISVWQLNNSQQTFTMYTCVKKYICLIVNWCKMLINSRFMNKPHIVI